MGDGTQGPTAHGKCMTETLAQKDGLIKDNWYVACLSSEVGVGKVIQRIVYDQALAIFRTQSGKVSILQDRCLHRMALLSLGEVRGEHLTCMYHGWEYNREGQVQRIPSEDPESKDQGRYCQTKIYSCEQEGAIWVWMGSGEPTTSTPPWRFPERNNPEWESYFMITDFPNEVTNLAENFMDVPHTVFVHRGWFRDEQKERKKIPTTVEVAKSRVLVTYHQEKDEFSWGARMLLNPKGAPMKHTDEFIYPNITRVDYWFGDNGFIINSQGTPVSNMNTRVYTYIAYKIPLFKKILKPVFGYYTRQVIEQDVVIMQNQARCLKLHQKPQFHSTECDELHVQIERLRFYGKTGHPLLHTYESKKEIYFWI